MLKYRVFRWMINNPPTNTNQVEATYVITGDTLINGNVYNVLYKDTVDNDTVRAKELINTGFLRKHTNAIWRLDSNNVEQKLFDFNVMMGDSLKWLFYTAKLINVSSFTYNGMSYDLYNVDAWSTLHTYRYTEDFAHLYGQGILDDNLVYIPIGIHQIFELVTFNNEVMKAGYTPDYIDTMGGKLNIPNTEKETTIHIYPNPADNLLMIENHSPKLLSMVIFNVMGEVVLREDLKDNITNLDISCLNTGGYYYKIYGHNETTKIGRFVKR